MPQRQRLCFVLDAKTQSDIHNRKIHRFENTAVRPPQITCVPDFMNGSPSLGGGGWWNCSGGGSRGGGGGGSGT